MSSLCQIWEQQLLSFILHEERKDNGKSQPPDNFKLLMKKYEEYGIHIERFKYREKIEEMRLIVNVIKHGDGNSAEKLRKKKPGLFFISDKNNKIDLLKLYSSSLLEPTLQISENDIAQYTDALVSFWNEFPERSIKQ